MFTYDVDLIKSFRVPREFRTSEELLSISSLNAFMQYNSANRGVMASSHISQTLVLEDGDEKIVQSGLDHQLAQSTFAVRIKEDCYFIAMVERYKTFEKDNQTIEVLIFVENVDGTFDYYSIPYYFSLHTVFGFQYVYRYTLDELRSMKPGTELLKDTVLADSPSVKENDGYALGVNANILLGTKFGQEEDGVICSESFAKKLSYSVFERRVLEFGSDKFLLNIYGDDKTYKGFPDIGEMIGPDGVLGVLRTYTPEMTPSLMSVNDLRRFSPDFDRAVYVGPGEMVERNGTMVPSGVVVDIKGYFNHKNKGKNNVIPITLGSTEDIINKLRDFYDQILSIYNTDIKSRKSNTRGGRGSNLREDGTLKLSPALTSLIEEALVIANKDNKKIAYVNKNTGLDVFYLEFTIQYREQVRLGSKITGLNG